MTKTAIRSPNQAPKPSANCSAILRSETAFRLLAESAKAYDIRALHLGAMPGNPAKRLYERNGFVDRGSRLMTRRL